jgi:arginine exporter protein ArgO
VLEASGTVGKVSVRLLHAPPQKLHATGGSVTASFPFFFLTGGDLQNTQKRNKQSVLIGFLDLFSGVCSSQFSDLSLVLPLFGG